MVKPKLSSQLVNLPGVCPLANEIPDSTMSISLKLNRIPVNAYMNLFPFFMGTPLSSVLFFLFLSPKGTIEYEHI